MWQISGPPLTVACMGNNVSEELHDFKQIGGPPISPKWTKVDIVQQFPAQILNLKGVSQLLYLKPHNVGHFEKTRSANPLRKDQFQKISTISCSKSKLEFYEKMQTHVFRVCFEQMGEGMLIDPKWTNFDFFNNFMHKVKIQKGRWLDSNQDQSRKNGKKF